MRNCSVSCQAHVYCKPLFVIPGTSRQRDYSADCAYGAIYLKAGLGGRYGAPPGIILALKQKGTRHPLPLPVACLISIPSEYCNRTKRILAAQNRLARLSVSMPGVPFSTSLCLATSYVFSEESTFHITICLAANEILG